MTETPTEAAIRRFLIEEILYDRELKDLSPTDNLIERGLLDSLGILKTVTFCEEQFGITIPDDQVLPDNMESVRAIAKLVEARRSA
ncbi:MAG: acyl carrier protein [Candidatus Eisenbacteria bacterium]|nr:acyl carrier protein [Candidatus Eisenbacteria bacterium]